VGHFKRKFQVEGGTYLCWYQKTRVISLSCGIKILAVCSFVSLQSTRVTNGGTDRRAELRSEDCASMAPSRGKYVSLPIDTNNDKM